MLILAAVLILSATAYEFWKINKDVGKTDLKTANTISKPKTKSEAMPVADEPEPQVEETKTQPEDADGLINYARRIEAVKVAILIQEQQNDTDLSGENIFHVSLRSDGEIDVAAIASSFGGGGHASAAGFLIQTPLPALKSQIFDLAEAL